MRGKRDKEDEGRGGGGRHRECEGKKEIKRMRGKRDKEDEGKKR